MTGEQTPIEMIFSYCWPILREDYLKILVSIEELVSVNEFYWKNIFCGSETCFEPQAVDFYKSLFLLTNSIGRVFFVGVKRFMNLELLVSIEELVKDSI